MFGSKKQRQELQHGKDVGQKIGAALTEQIHRYCGRIVYIESSQMLMSLARELDELPDGDWLDDQFMKPRLLLVGEFLLKCHQRMLPLREQLATHIDEVFGTLFQNAPDIRTLAQQLIDQRFNQEIDGMLAAAGYLSGVSGAYTTELAKKHEPQTPSG